MLHEGKCNLPSAPISDGDSPVAVRVGKFGEHLQSNFWPDHSHPTFRKFNFHSIGSAVTVGTNHVSPCTANTGHAIHGCFNPPNSGRHLHIVKHSCHTISGTPGGPLIWNYFINQTWTCTPNVTPVCGFLGGANCTSQWFSDVALTGCTIGLVLKHAWRLPALATGWSEGPPAEDDDGDIIVPPGCGLGIFAYAAGTSHVVQISVTFAEYPVSTC